MKIGMIGLGKLGLPVILGIESKGHEVMGFDINPDIATYLKERKIPFKEEGLQPLLDKTELKLASNIDEVVKWADIVFCAIQTPHEAKFEGSTRIPKERKDFDYTFIKKAITEVAKSAKANKKHTYLVLISTCLPGTYTREIEPTLNEYVHYAYNPFFIAMGTVLKDFFDPEFVLIGTSYGEFFGDYVPDFHLERFYETIHDKDCLNTDITTAEAIKVSYNTFITTKTVLANLWGEIAHKTGANVDDIFRAWEMSTDRLMSSRYLKAGMGDGGGCHPRDNIALSYIAKEIGLSFNYFEALMEARENHADWLASVISDAVDATGYPVILLGKSFKPETDIQTGSPAILLANLLGERNIPYIHVGEHDEGVEGKCIYFIATQHAKYNRPYVKGSVVIDPFGYIEDQPGVDVIRIGRP